MQMLMQYCTTLRVYPLIFHSEIWSSHFHRILEIVKAAPSGIQSWKLPSPILPGPKFNGNVLPQLLCPGSSLSILSFQVKK